MVLGSETVGAEPGRSQLEEKEPWVGGVCERAVFTYLRAVIWERVCVPEIELINEHFLNACSGAGFT